MAGLIVDTSPLIFLGQLGRIPLLERRAPVYVPSAVLREVEQGTPKDPRTLPAVRRLLETGNATLRKSAPPSSFLPELGEGERSVLYLAGRMKEAIILLDERRARRIAEASGFKVDGTAFFLLEALEARALNRSEFKSDIQRLQRLNYFIAPHLLQRVLMLADQL